MDATCACLLQDGSLLGLKKQLRNGLSELRQNVCRLVREHLPPHGWPSRRCLRLPPKRASSFLKRIYREGRPATKPALRLSLRSLPGSSGGAAAAAAGCPASPALKPSSDRSCLAIRFLAAKCSPQRTACTCVICISRPRKRHSLDSLHLNIPATKCLAESSAFGQHSAL